MQNYYGQQGQSANGFLDQITQWCREWLNASTGINKQNMASWIETKGAIQIANRLAAINPNPPVNFAKQFVISELNNVSAMFPAGYQQQQQQPSFQNNPAQNSYGGGQITTQPTQPQMQEEVQEEEEFTFASPTPESETEFSVPGASGTMTLYISDDESRFSHVKLRTNIAFGNDRDLVDYLADVKPPGRSIIQMDYMKLKRFKIPAAQFKEVVSAIGKMMKNTTMLKSMTDVELFEAYTDCLSSIPAGMVNKMTSIVLGLISQFTRSRFLQSSEDVGPTIMLGQAKDIYALLTNDISLDRFKSVHGYNGRIRSIMELVLETIAKVNVDDGSEFGEESPWLTMCGNLPLPDGSGLVKSAYLSPEGDHIKVQKELAEKYTVIGIPSTTFVVFDKAKSRSAFAKLTKPKNCEVITQPKDDIEYIICLESGGLLLSEIILVDALYPYPQFFTHGETIDHVSVITRW